MTLLSRMSSAGLVNPRAIIGGNNPPSRLESAKDAGCVETN